MKPHHVAGVVAAALLAVGASLAGGVTAAYAYQSTPVITRCNTDPAVEVVLNVQLFHRGRNLNPGGINVMCGGASTVSDTIHSKGPKPDSWMITWTFQKNDTKESVETCGASGPDFPTNQLSRNFCPKTVDTNWSAVTIGSAARMSGPVP